MKIFYQEICDMLIPKYLSIGKQLFEQLFRMLGPDRKDKQAVDESNNDVHDNDKEEELNNQVESRKRDRGQWFPDDVQHKVLINNKRKEKMLEVDSAFEGIFLYKPGMELPSLFHYANETIKVIIASEYIKKNNLEVVKRNIFGSETYTSNSDCVCIGIHSGLINLNNFQTKKYEGVEIIFKVIKPKKNYTGTCKNGIVSRTIKGYNGNALKPESMKLLTTLGSIENLERYASNMHIPIGKSRLRSKPRNTSSIIPIPETHIVFNMNNEPAYKYSILNLADKGLQKNEFIKKKLEGQVLYLENDLNQKFELSKVENEGVELFKFGKVNNPLLFDNDYFESGRVPLEPKDLDLICPSVEWSQILWGNQSMQVKDKLIKGLTSFKYYKKSGK